MSYCLKIAARLALVVALVDITSRYAVRVFDLSRKDYGEGPILAMVERMGREPVSSAWLHGPEYTLGCYGPGYYWSVQMAAAVAPWDHSLIPGRLVALAAALATAGLIALVVGRRLRSLEIGLFSGLLYLVSSVVFMWVPYQRVDALAVLFGIGAYMAAHPLEGHIPCPSNGKARRGLVASAILVAAGSLIKQTVALTAIPILVHLIFCKRYRDALIYAVLVCVLGAGLWSAVDFRSGGFFLTAAIRGNLNRTDLWQGFQLAVGFLQCPTALVGIIVVAWVAKHAPGQALGSLFCVGFVLESLIALAAASKQGASINYYLQPCALAAVVIGLHGVPRICPRRTAGALAGLGLLSLVLVIPGVGDFPAGMKSIKQLPTSHPRSLRLLEAAGPARVLADGKWIDLALAAGARPMVNDPFVFRLMVDNGTVNAAKLIDAMRQEPIEFLLLSRSIDAHRQAVGQTMQRWPVEVLDAMEADYVLMFREGGIWVYQRQPAHAEERRFPISIDDPH